MKHNPIQCAHCGHAFDFSETDLLVDGNVFEGLCEVCREGHVFSVHVLQNVPTTDGVVVDSGLQEEEMKGQIVDLKHSVHATSVMVDVQPKREPTRPMAVEVVSGGMSAARELIRSGRVSVRRGADDDGELPVSEGTLKDISDLFDPRGGGEEC